MCAVLLLPGVNPMTVKYIYIVSYIFCAATRLQAGDLRTCESLVGTGDVFFFVKALRLVVGSTQPPVWWAPGVLRLGVRWLGHEADHSISSAGVKEEWDYVCTASDALMACIGQLKIPVPSFSSQVLQLVVDPGSNTVLLCSIPDSLWPLPACFSFLYIKPCSTPFLYFYLAVLIYLFLLL
jgi:hypothetical protein